MSVTGQGKMAQIGLVDDTLHRAGAAQCAHCTRSRVHERVSRLVGLSVRVFVRACASRTLKETTT
jgi:hypothetical protein